MGRKAKIQLLDDPVFVKESLRSAVRSVQKALESEMGAPHAEALTNSMIRLLDALLKPQVDEITRGIQGHGNRLQALEEQVTNLNAMYGLRAMDRNGPRRAPSPMPYLNPAPPQYQGPTPEDAIRAQRS